MAQEIEIDPNDKSNVLNKYNIGLFANNQAQSFGFYVTQEVYDNCDFMTELDRAIDCWRKLRGRPQYLAIVGVFDSEY